MSTTLSMEDLKADDKVMSPVEIFSLIREDLISVEHEFSNQVDDASPQVSSIVRYLLESGGKRVRPALVLLGSVKDEPGGCRDRFIALLLWD